MESQLTKKFELKNAWNKNFTREAPQVSVEEASNQP